MAHYRGQARVYDIVNAGPRHRFTVSNVLVHNCGFGGGRGALRNMAANYGMHLSEEEAWSAVSQWREANPWAVDFWRALWSAADDALNAPGEFKPVGRVGFIFLPEYLGGSLLCQLPSGRFLTYRGARYERVEELDDDGVVIDVKWKLTYGRGYGRLPLWPGIFAENITQASAACILRATLVDVQSWAKVCAHVHDEVVLETPVEQVAQTQPRLLAAMERNPDWAEGLPLKAEVSCGYSYTKCSSAQGL